MTDWGSYIDRQIRKAMDEGNFSNLPGEGKPLQLEDNPNTPNEMRMAYKILRDNDLAPDWIMQGKSLDVRIENLLGKLSRVVGAYRTVLHDPAATALTRARAEEALKTSEAKLAGLAAKINQEINSYNLKVPAGVAHKTLLNIQHEKNRLIAGR